jgi:hypothetical protein
MKISKRKSEPPRHAPFEAECAPFKQWFVTAAAEHLCRMRDRAARGSKKDEIIRARLREISRKYPDAPNAFTWAYMHVAQDLRRQLLDQLAKRQGR